LLLIMLLLAVLFRARARARLRARWRTDSNLELLGRKILLDAGLNFLLTVKNYEG
jgi:hypothetical protein